MDFLDGVPLLVLISITVIGGLVLSMIIPKLVHGLEKYMNEQNSKYTKNVYEDKDGFRSELEHDTGVSISKYVCVTHLDDKMPSSLELQLPTWEHARMNGVADARMKVNKKIYHDSTLILGNYKMTSGDPSIMLDLANKLRERGFNIPLSKIEKEVLDRLSTKTLDKKLLDYREKLARKFMEDQTSFTDYCLNLLRESGYSTISRKTENDLVIIHNVARHVICICLLPNQKLNLTRAKKIIKDNRNKHLFIITNSTFTDNAKEYCRLNDSTIMDGRGLLELMSKPKKIQDTVDPALLRTLLPTDMDKDMLEF